MEKCQFGWTDYEDYDHECRNDRGHEGDHRCACGAVYEVL